MKLKPCPFCGSTDLAILTSSASVVCHSCWTLGPDAGEEAAAKEAWNKRPGEIMRREAMDEILDRASQCCCTEQVIPTDDEEDETEEDE